MNELSNLFNNISNVFNFNTAKETYLNPFTANDYRNDFKGLNNDDDKFTSDAIKEKVSDTIKTNSSKTDKDAAATAILAKLKELSGSDISSSEFLQNFNASIAEIKDPGLQNALRKQLTTDINRLSEEKLKKLYESQDTRKQWGEIAYESSLAKLKEESASVNNKLNKLVSSGNQKDINDFVSELKKEFGNVENFNELLNDAGIKYKITGSEANYKIERNTGENSTENKIEDKKVKDGKAYRDSLDTWDKNAEYINNLDTSEFKDKDKKAAADKEISELANLTGDGIQAGKYTDAEIKEKFDLLTKAYKYNLETGEFSKAELERARMNLISLAHENEKDNLAKWRTAEKKDAKANPDYEGVFSDDIAKINTIAFLRDKGTRENLIEPGLKFAAKSLGHTDANGNGDIKKATGGESSELSKLIEAVKNPAVQKTEDPEIKQLNTQNLNEINYGSEKAELKFKFGDNQEYSTKINEFLKGLADGSITVTDSKGNLSEIDIDKEKTQISEDGNNYKITISSKDGKDVSFTINKDAFTDDIVREASGGTYKTVAQFIEAIKNKNES